MVGRGISRAVWLGVAALGTAGASLAADRYAVVSRAPKELRTPMAYVPLTINATTLPWVRRATSALSGLRGGERVRGVSTQHRTVPATGGRPAVGVLTSERPDRPKRSAALLWIHGGGYVIGTVAGTTPACRAWARDLNLLVVSVDYRLAPEAPYPAAIDDCFSALAWLHANADELGIDPGRIAVGGDSAGGGLAASLAQRAVDEGLDVAFQLLVYPMLDDRTCGREAPDGVGQLGWTPASNVFGWTSYLGRPPGGPDAGPYAVASRRSSLAGLPPAWIGVGTTDLFVAEDVAYAERLTAAGVAVDLEIIEGLFHGADQMAPQAPLTREFTLARDEALRAGLGLDLNV